MAEGINQIDLGKIIKNRKIEMLQEDHEENNNFALLNELVRANKETFLDTNDLEVEMNIEANSFFC